MFNNKHLIYLFLIHEVVLIVCIYVELTFKCHIFSHDWRLYCLVGRKCCPWCSFDALVSPVGFLLCGLAAMEAVWPQKTALLFLISFYRYTCICFPFIFLCVEYTFAVVFVPVFIRPSLSFPDVLHLYLLWFQTPEDNWLELHRK